MKDSGELMSKTDMSNTLEANLASQAELCRNLEKLADDLPNNVDLQNCLTLAKAITPILREAHEFEEKTLFPELKSKFSDDEQLMATLERLRFEHWEDESFADELRESLIGYATAQTPEVVNSLPYMLRGFFEGVRRHVAFEREHILPILVKSRS